MKFSIKPTDPFKLETDVLLYFSYENEVLQQKGIPSQFMDEIKFAADKEGFAGREDQQLVLSGRNLISPYKFILSGLGKKEEIGLFKLYSSVASSIKKAKEGRPVKIAIVLDDYISSKFQVEKAIQACVEAIILSTYTFLKYKSEEERAKDKPIEEILLNLPPGKISAAEVGLKKGEIVAAAVLLARDLVNEPAEVTSPNFLAETALQIAKESDGKVKVKILEKEEVAKLGMNSFLGVSQGSLKPPKFIHLSYKPVNSKKKIVLIGKGITFDTGGLSLKGAEHMETMKLDMSGAATVLSVFSSLAKLLPQVWVVGLIAACENMPGGSALKPGDILKAMNGKTIEVLNTDAEGRLTLADAISYAKIREKPDEIIDLATLTGACMVALGEDIAGLWSNDDKLSTIIEKSAKHAGEQVWRMPLFEDYRKLHKSHIADIKNIQTGKYAGAIAGALFLSEFVGNTPWVHLDIAGPAYSEKDLPLTPIGGTGFGVRTLLEYLANI